MAAKKDICAVCAWRGTCNKKYTVSGKGIRCVDFVRDVALGPEEEPEREEISFKKRPEEEEENY
ncbi:MAG: hypothetical protein AABY78_00935 [Nitrospirota bacterium]